jgi:SagB-type dehydrogenase family enzyme
LSDGPADVSPAGVQRLRRSSTLLFAFEGHSPVVYNFLTRAGLPCTPLCMDLLARVADWTEAGDLLGSLLDYSSASVAREIGRLLESGALLLDETAEARRDAEFVSNWEWGATAGLYHFGIRDTRYFSDEEGLRWLREHRRGRPPPPLMLRNDGFARVVTLPAPSRSPLLEIIRARRSRRAFGADPITCQDLADCLHAGLGIVGFVEHPDLGRMPLKNTPSGGARNPFEAYVYASNVRDLARGVYHYSASEQSLGLIGNEDLPRGSDLIGGQAWGDSAAALVLLLANFERTMWKYPHPAGYRVVLIEAGHIVQNILLVAASRGIDAAPTAAISDSAAERAIGKPSMGQAVVYCVALGMAPSPHDRARERV